MSNIAISELPAEQAASLVPLVLQVHALHAAALPDLYPADPAPADVTAFLHDWLKSPAVTALVSGPRNTPKGYLIYEIERRPPSVLRKGQTRAMLHHICVDEGLRGMGIGSGLIDAMRTGVARTDACLLMTSYAAFNERSARLMARNGFSPQTILASAPI